MLVGAWFGATTGEDATPASWSLLGVADGGRSLRVRGPDHGACDRVTLAVEESDARIVVSAFIRTPRGALSCIAMLVAGRPTTLALDAPVAGRTVTGPKKVLDAARFRSHAPRDHAEAPDDADPRPAGPPTRPLPVPAGSPPAVVGLRYRDARDALCNGGFQALTAPRGAGHGRVVAQRPARRQSPTGRSREPTCTNGMLPAVDVTTHTP